MERISERTLGNISGINSLRSWEVNRITSATHGLFSKRIPLIVSEEIFEETFKMNLLRNP